MMWHPEINGDKSVEIRDEGVELPPQGVQRKPLPIGDT